MGAKAVPANLRAIIDNLPKAASPEDTPVDPDFVRAMIQTGKAVKLEPGQELPEDAEYEVRIENGTTRLIHHRVSAR